jgi:probable HAF family extracellular repeat protein
MFSRVTAFMLALGVISMACAKADSFVVTQIPQEEGEAVWPLALNNNGEVVGYVVKEPGTIQHGFIWSRGHLVMLGTLSHSGGGSVPRHGSTTPVRWSDTPQPTMGSILHFSMKMEG